MSSFVGLSLEEKEAQNLAAILEYTKRTTYGPTQEAASVLLEKLYENIRRQE